MKLYNSLSRQVEEIVPIEAGKIGMYTCGPTVYSTATIGNFRTYTLSDVLARALRYVGYEVKLVMNLTDVGHLTGDNEGDSSQGEDRLEKASKKEGKTAWDIAKGYSDEFMGHIKMMNIEMPTIVCKATDHIPEQIAMVQQLESNGLTYKISDGIYFDTLAFEAKGFTYGELSNLDEMKKGARLEPNPEKKNPRDFALWKFSPSDGTKRQMEWESPWGVGFPGWHIECSAMSTKYLGDQFDIHAGGEDLRSTHHPNEIAQAEGATGKKPFVKTWVHGAFLLVDGGRMGKSLGNAYTIADIVAKGFDPLALRYFYLTGHYRKQINFTWDSLASAATALTKLRELYQNTKVDGVERVSLSAEKMEKIEAFQDKFTAAIENDLNMSEALAVLWEMAKSNIPNYDKVDMMMQFDRVLGLQLDKPISKDGAAIPENIEKLIEQRETMRKMRNYDEADKIRQDIEKLGYHLEDKGVGPVRSKISLVIFFVFVVVGIWWGTTHTRYVMLNPKGEEVLKEKPYEKYSFENLAKRGGVASKIEVLGNKFYFKSEGRRISGEINMPTRTDLVGVVVMARGYVEKEGYRTGLGTHNAAKYFSESGHITYAPDFSGYGESDPEDENALGARLVKPVEILDLIASVQATTKLPIYLWGHSNGGQIMISVAEILGSRKTVNPYSSESVIRGVTLWAPVSKPFPYNILYYTDDASDSGKWLRGQISEFEETYDVFNYSIDRYLDWINIPIQIHQGSLDEAVPKVWSDKLVESLKLKDKRVTYFVYPGADHNMKPNWDSVVTRDLEFFQSL